MSEGLFRVEPVRERQASWLGGIRLAPRAGFAVVAAFSLVLCLAAGAFLSWGQVARKVRLPGLVLPSAGMHHVTAPQAGVLHELRVAEGQLVTRGQVLLTLGSERHLATGEAHALLQVALDQRRDSLHAELRLIDQQHTQHQVAGAERLRSLQASQRQAALEQLALGHRLRLAQSQLQRQRQLQAEGFVSAAQAQVREDELLELQMREAALSRQAQALAQEQRSAVAELQQAEASAQTARAQVQRALAALEQERVELEARRLVVMRAPVDGKVTLTALRQGQAAQPGQLLVALQPQGPEAPAAAAAGIATPASLQAHLFAPSRAAGFVQPGQTVWLRYAPYPYAKFGLGRGTVQQVSETALTAHEWPVLQAQGVVGPLAAAEPVRRITVVLEQPYLEAYGQRRALTPGTLLEADVVQDTRAIWEWLFEPLLAARQQMKVLSGDVGPPGTGG